MQIKKGYKQTEIGVIPEDWEIEKLEDQISKMVGGGTPSRNKAEYWNGNVFWATVKDISSFNPNYTKETITKEGLTNSASTLIKKGTVIITARMALGKAVIYNVDVAINQDLKALFTKSCLIPKFLFYWFERNLQSIENLGNGSTVKGISTADLKSLFFPKISLAEQQAIAAALSDVDALISSLDQLITKKCNIKQGAMQELLTGKKRLAGFDKSGGKFKQTEIGTIPEDWNVKNLEDVSIITRLAGAEYSSVWKETKNGEIIALRGFNIGKNRIIDKDIVRISNHLSLKLNRSRLYSGDVVYPCVGTIGNAVVIEENDKYHIQQNIAKITPNNKLLSSYFLAHYLMSNLGLNEVIRFNASSSQPNVLVGSLKKYRVPFPPLPEQQAIAAILSDMDAEIEKLEQQRDKYKAIKQGMMQELLTGKTRLV